MRRPIGFLGFVLLAVLTGWETYEFCVTNKGIRYFVSEPHRLLFVTSIALVGGGAVWALSRLSPAALRSLRLWTLAGFATCVTCFLAVFTACLVSFSPVVTDSGMWGWMAVTLGALVAVAGLLWFEFHQVWKQIRGAG
ncbi:MAG: hypothetical protein KIS67_00190 [Verrucomicrobiae bacterium]|nr:hypothetical protein [Verrucomicrobiae bacterium]